MMKNYLLAAATVAAFAFWNSTVFAACTDSILVQASIIATPVTEQKLQEGGLTQSAFALLAQARTLCSQGDESGAAQALEQLKMLLATIGQ